MSKKESIPGTSDFIERSTGVVIWTAFFLWNLIIMPIATWYAFPERDLWIRIALPCLFIAVSLYFIIKDRGWFIGTILRLLAGEANIEVRPDGFHLSRRFGSQHYDWTEICRLELVYEDAWHETEFNIVFHFKDGRDICVASDRDWQVLDLLRKWSGGILGKVEVVVGRYDKVGEFIELRQEGEKERITHHSY